MPRMELDDLKRNASDDVRRLNPDVFGTGEQSPVPSTGQEADSRQKKLRRRFERMWQEAGGPALTEEYRFDESRRWRADYAHLPSRTLIELEGGVWSGGRHTRGKGYIKDAEKYREAAMQGWTVVRLPTGFKRAEVDRIVQHVNEQHESREEGKA